VRALGHRDERRPEVEVDGPRKDGRKLLEAKRKTRAEPELVAVDEVGRAAL